MGAKFSALTDRLWEVVQAASPQGAPAEGEPLPSPSEQPPPPGAGLDAASAPPVNCMVLSMGAHLASGNLVRSALQVSGPSLFFLAFMHPAAHLQTSAFFLTGIPRFLAL